MRKTVHTKLKILILTAFVLLSITGCVSREAYKFTGFYFDTIVNIEIYDDRDVKADLKDIEKGCRTLCEAYENMLSSTVRDSDIWLINHSNGKSVTVSDETAELLEKACEYADMTSGAFDPAIAALSELWNISEVCVMTDDKGNLLSEEELREHIPDDDSIGEALKHTDYRQISIEGNRVTLEDPEMKIDLGAIAKGYISEKLREYLIGMGVSCGVINLGGNILTIGGKPDGSSFVLGIQKPFDESGTVIGTITGDDRAVVTSGSYQRYYEVDGVKYHHILDPAKGYPSEGNLYSVTVITDDATLADVLSTAFFVMGYEDSLKLIDRLETEENSVSIEAIFITDKYELMATPGIAEEYKSLQ